MEDKLVELYDLSWRSRVCKALEAANRLGVFTGLGDESLGLEEICLRCNTKPDATAKLLEICAVMGWVEMEGGIYRNSDFARRYLVAGSELYQGDIIAHGATVSAYWAGLENVVSQEELPGEDEAEGHRHFIMAMRDIAAGGRGEMFIENIDLGGRKRMLDVGGGPASYSIAACRKYPELSVTLFDLEATIAIARQQVDEADMAERIELRVGDWDADEFGEGYDVVLFSNVLHGPADGAASKLAKGHGAMVEGGLLVVQDFVLKDEGAGPLVPAVFNMMVGAFRKGELFSVIEGAGFSDVRIVAADERIGSTWITAIRIPL